MFHLSTGFGSPISQTMSSHALLREIRAQTLFCQSPRKTVTNANTADMPDYDDTLSTEALRAEDDPIWRMPAELRGPIRHRQSSDAMKKNH